jgi:hypothetical protein
MRAKAAKNFHKKQLRILRSSQNAYIIRSVLYAHKDDNAPAGACQNLTPIPRHLIDIFGEKPMNNLIFKKERRRYASINENAAAGLR